MTELHSPQYLTWAIALIPLLLLGIWSYYALHRQLRRYADKALWSTLVPDRAWGKRLMRDILFLIALGLLLYAVARPQSSASTGKQTGRQGIEAVLCVDVSNSMLSTDVSPSRIEFTKHCISKLLDQMQSDRVAIVVFAGDAYIQLPMTTDLSTAQTFLGDLRPSMLSAQGTNIAQAIRLARQSFSSRTDIGKAIVIFSDGEDHDGGVDEELAKAKDEGIHTSVVGVGSEQGGMIPYQGGYLSDNEGKPVVTRLNAEMCEQIAQTGKGVFVASTSQSEVVGTIQRELNHLPKASVDRGAGGEYIEHFARWTWIALVLLILEMLIMERKNHLLVRNNIFGHEQ